MLREFALAPVLAAATAAWLPWPSNVGSALASVAAQVSTIQSEITTAQGEIATLLAGTVPGAHVSFSGGGLAATNAQAAIVELAGAVSADVSTLTTSLAAAVAVSRLRANIVRI